jgi:hypothetical protein
LRQLQAIDELRDRAASVLREISAAHGQDSLFYRGCAALWARKDEAAFESLVHGDFDNAIVLLDHGLSALALGPRLAANEGLAPREALLLMAG